MPLYEYKCKKGHVFDAIQSFSEDPLTKCEVCGAKCERVLSAPSIHFKGSGFYNTDYGTKRRAKENAANAASEKSAAKDSGSSDSSSSKSESSSSSKSETTSSASTSSKD